jgi:hypothetical protein
VGAKRNAGLERPARSRGADAILDSKVREQLLVAEHRAEMQLEALAQRALGGRALRARPDHREVVFVLELARPIDLARGDEAVDELGRLARERRGAAHARGKPTVWYALVPRKCRDTETSSRAAGRAIRVGGFGLRGIGRIDLLVQAPLDVVLDARQPHAARVPAVRREHHVVVQLQVPERPRRGAHRERRVAGEEQREREERAPHAGSVQR